MALKIDGASVSRSNARILRDVSLTVEAGEIVGLLGPNGAGKSTFLNAVAGDFDFGDGNATLNGVKLASLSVKERARRVAFLRQRAHIPLPLAVHEVIGFGVGAGACRRGLRRGERDRRVAMLAERLKVAHLVARDVTTLSGGEAQRVHLARVLGQIWQDAPQQPRLLLLDEPTSALDPGQAAALAAELRSLAREQNLAVLAVIHDLSLASRLADRLLVLHGGVIAAAGAPGECLSDDTIHHVFGPGLSVKADALDALPVILPAFRAEARQGPDSPL